MGVGKNNLVKALKKVGHLPLELGSSAGASVLILPYGGRILGLFPTDNSANLLWTNPLLNESQTATDFFLIPGWRNTGGGRTWISPERAIHVGDLEDPWNTYHVPESVDPGPYEAEVNDDEVHLRVTGAVVNHRTGQRCGVQLNKTIRLVPNPLRHHPEAQDILDGVSYVGVEQIASLRYVDPISQDTPALSLWDAVNLPAIGTIVIPTVRKIEPTDFFEATGTSRMQCMPSGVSFLFDGCERHKIAIRAVDLLGGRVGYLRQIGDDEFTLVVRNFATDPSAEYIDAPWARPQDLGYVLECYNDGGSNGSYGELEYHSPAMGLGTGRSECLDRAQLWGFQGLGGKIHGIMNRLVGEAATRELTAFGTRG